MFLVPTSERTVCPSIPHTSARPSVRPSLLHPPVRLPAHQSDARPSSPLTSAPLSIHPSVQCLFFRPSISKIHEKLQVAASCIGTAMAW